jgi:WhiB family redox-sensing transcriptional regulator
MSPAPDQVKRVARFRTMVARFDDDSWRSFAACRDVDPDLFFPSGTTGGALAQTDAARAVCAGCPVRIACLTFAVATNQEFGVWGGCDEEQRRALRRKWRAGVDPFEGPDDQSQPAAS